MTDMNVDLGCTHLCIVAHPYLCSPPHAILHIPATLSICMEACDGPDERTQVRVLGRTAVNR